MTKIQLVYDLVRPLSDQDALAISNVHSYYGFQRVKVMQDDRIEVEYDASRLSEKDVESVLIQYAIPIRRKWATS